MLESLLWPLSPFAFAPTSVFVLEAILAAALVVLTISLVSSRARPFGARLALWLIPTSGAAAFGLSSLSRCETSMVEGLATVGLASLFGLIVATIAHPRVPRAVAPITIVAAIIAALALQIATGQWWMSDICHDAVGCSLR